jgi:tetratricopeptide (TPR) repeat protein
MMPASHITGRLLTAIAATLYTLTLTAQSAEAWRDSLTVLNRKIEQWPQSTDLRLRKAAVNIELNQWDYAVEEYGKILQIDPGNPAALYFRAYGNVHLRRYAIARTDYEELLLHVPLHMEARIGLANVYELMGRKTDAANQYNQLVQMFPDSAVCYAARAAFETTMGQYDTALYDWDEAIARQPLNADYVATKADLLLRLQRTDEARKLLEQAIVRGIPQGLLLPWTERCRTPKRH